MYELTEVPGPEFADTLDKFNAMDADFPPLTDRHYEDGYWWLVFRYGEAVAFAGLVPFEPFDGVGYCKRCLVRPDHFGHGLQYRLLCARIVKAKQLGWRQLVSECRAANQHSANNFRRAGFDLCEPEQRWGAPLSLYWVRDLC